LILNFKGLAGEIQAMEQLKENAMMLYTEFSQNLKKELEKSGLAQHGGDLQGFQSNVEKALEDLFNEVKGSLSNLFCFLLI